MPVDGKFSLLIPLSLVVNGTSTASVKGHGSRKENDTSIGVGDIIASSEIGLQSTLSFINGAELTLYYCRQMIINLY